MKLFTISLSVLLACFLALAETANKTPVRGALEPSEELTVFPHITTGNGWTTKFVLFNVSNTPVFYRMVFYDNRGRAASYAFKDRGNISEIFGTLNAFGSIRFETAENSSMQETQFWAALEEGSGAITGVQTFEFRRGDGTMRSATVPISDDFTVDPIIVPFDNTDGMTTAMAITNTDNLQSPSAHTIRIRGVNENGSVISDTTMRIEAGDKPAFLTGDKIPALAGQKGVLYLDAEDGAVGDFAVLALQFDDAMNFSAVLPFEGVLF